MAGAFVDGSEIKTDRKLDCDVCIVGSGAGGAVTAAGLAERGLKVIVLEAGGHHTKAEFDMQEAHTYPMLYQDDGGRSTTDRSVSVMQGRAVGGSTVVNWTSSFRTPKRILDHWAKVHHFDTLTVDLLTPHWEAVEKRLGIHEWTADRNNQNNDILARGCEKLGWHHGQIRRNVRECIASGYCGMGCPVDAKQAMHITYLPDAVAKGAIVQADARVLHIAHKGRRATEVRAEVLDRATKRPNGKHITVRAKVVVVSGGAINSPALLLRSGIDVGGRTGKRTFIHPVVAMGGYYEKKIEAYYGAPQSAHSHQMIDRGKDKLGLFFETAPLHPMLAAVSLGGFGAVHENQMTEFPNVGSLIAIAVDGLTPEEEGGRVTLRPDGYPRFDYPLGDLHMEAFRAGMKALARIHLAAGAKEVRSLHDTPVRIQAEKDIDGLDAAPWGPLRFPVFTAHLMGGCQAGADPGHSIVDTHLKHHAMDNLFVIDGSIFPTALGVNPQLTIYGIAHWAVDHVAKAAG